MQVAVGKLCCVDSLVAEAQPDVPEPTQHNPERNIYPTETEDDIGGQQLHQPLLGAVAVADQEEGTGVVGEQLRKGTGQRHTVRAWRAHLATPTGKKLLRGRKFQGSDQLQVAIRKPADRLGQLRKQFALKSAPEIGFE